jgi:Tol biopolymer transport system component
LADTVARFGGAWNRDGVIIFSPAAEQLATVSASGGPVTPLALAGAWPSFLPDGRHFLYHSEGHDPRSRGVYVGSLDSTATHQLLTSDFKAAYAAPGFLLFVREETLLGQSFDPERLTLMGDPFVVADGIWGAAAAAQASFSVSPTGTLAYVNATLFNRQVLAFDRRGQPKGPLTAPDRYFNQVPQLSPSGQQLAIARTRDGKDSVWVFDRATAASSRLTLNPDWSNTPVWSADGTRVVFMSGRGPGVTGSRLNLKRVNGTGQDEVLLEIPPPANGALWDWSSDGRFLVYSFFSPETKGVADLWVLPLEGARQPYPFLQSAVHKTQAQIAPNGHWIAYTSYESGKDEVYVQSFPIPGSKRQISMDGGVQPRWRRDGAELFYLATTQYLMAVPVKINGTFEAGSAVRLFRTKMLPQGSQSIVFYTAYDVTTDGQQFVLNVPPDDPGPPITVVQNWTAALKN